MTQIPAAYLAPDPDRGVLICGPAGTVARGLYPDGAATYTTGQWDPLTPEEAATVAAWQAATAMPLTLEDRVAALERAIFGTPDTPGITPAPDGEAPAWVAPTGAHDAIPPAALRTFPDGTIRQNISGGWLTHGPDQYPAGWAIVHATTDPDPDPEPCVEWSPDATYQVGDLATRDGVTYRCLVRHGPEYRGTWGPPAVGVWGALP